MGKGYRQGRLGEEIRKIIGSMLIHQIKDPRLSSMISISGVDVTSDGSYATCYVSVLDMNETGQEKEALEKDILAGLDSASGKMDHSIEYGEYIDKILGTMDFDSYQKDEEEDGEDPAE